MASLRIAQVAPLWMRVPPTTYGGTEVVMKLLIDELVARGHDVTLFGSADCQTAAQLEPVCDTNLLDMAIAGEDYVYEYYVNSATAQVLRQAGAFDLIHFHLSISSLPLAAMTPTPSLFTHHGYPQPDDEFVMRRWPQVEVTGISAHQVRGMGERLARALPVVHNGCDFGAFEPSYAPGQYLAFLGRLQPKKNPVGAIRLAQAAGLPIVLAGPKRSDDYFRDEIEPLLDGDRVRWIGPVDHAQKVALLRNAAALVFPVVWDEPFGLVMIEAMACGTPVIATGRGAVPEVVDQGVTGFHAEDLDALPALVAPALALDRREVRRHAQGRFGHLAMVDRYEALYRTLVQRGAN